MATASAHDIARTIAHYQLANPEKVQAAFSKYPTSPGKAINLLVNNSTLTPWQANRLLTGETQGYRYGKYITTERVGSTALARIYLAYENPTISPVRIIVFRRKHTSDVRQVDKLRATVEPLIGWKHPHCVSMIALGYEPQEGQHYLVTDIPPKTTFGEHLSLHGPMAPAAILSTLEQIAQTMVAAMGHHGIHGNIDSSSILMESAASIKIDNWAWPACFEHTVGADATECQMFYNAIAESAKIPTFDIRNDLFFLGCLMQHAVTGKAPLATSGSTPAEHIESMIPLGNDSIPGHPRLVRIIQSMTSRAIDNRFPSAIPLLDEVRQAQRSQNAQTPGSVSGTTVFVLENEIDLQNMIRERFKEYGYRVFIAADPARALERYSTSPFDAAIVDVGHLGVGILDSVDQLRMAADRADQRLRIVLLLDSKQSHLVKDYPDGPDLAALVRPFSVGRIHRTLLSLA